MIQSLGITLVDPDNTAALGTAAGRIEFPHDITIVAVSICPLEDDAGLTVDVQAAGSDVITAIAAADKDAVTLWESTHVNGTNDPVHVDAHDEITFDVNSAAAANAVQIVLFYEAGLNYE